MSASAPRPVATPVTNPGACANECMTAAMQGSHRTEQVRGRLRFSYETRPNGVRYDPRILKNSLPTKKMANCMIQHFLISPPTPETKKFPPAYLALVTVDVDGPPDGIWQCNVVYGSTMRALDRVFNQAP